MGTWSRRGSDPIPNGYWNAGSFPGRGIGLLTPSWAGFWNIGMQILSLRELLVDVLTLPGWDTGVRVGWRVGPRAGGCGVAVGLWGCGHSPPP